MKFWSVTLIVLALAYFFVFRSIRNDKASAPSERTTKNLFVEINPNKQWNEAGQLVRSFFLNWKNERFVEMYTQTIRAGAQARFTLNLSRTPIRVASFKIKDVDKNSAGWSVKLNAEITDLTSAFAACVVSVRGLPIPYPTDKSPFRYPPFFLGIEQFESVDQVWQVVEQDGKLYIDLGGERPANIMHYTIDAPTIVVESGPFLPFSPNFAVTSWMAVVGMMDRDLKSDDISQIMAAAEPLVTAGIIALDRFSEAVEAATKKSKQP